MMSNLPSQNLMALSVALFLLGATCAFADTAIPGQSSTPVQLVDALNGVFGVHPGARAVHAKGVVLEGTFKASSSAASISKAAHLQKNVSVPVTVRFSDFAGVPNIPDADGHASPHGLAIKFTLPDGSPTDIVAHSFNGFPSATPDDFRDLLIALGQSGPNAAKPTPLDTYLGSHPIAKAFLTAPKPAPVSYGTLPYFGVNTFKFINTKGKVAFGRYQFVPVAGDQRLTKEQAAKAAPDYLAEEIRQRVQNRPVKFKLLLQIAGKGDKIDDPSIAWPNSRRKVELGTIEITKAVSDSAAAEKALLFQPTALTAGIEVEDPMINARAAAYSVSFARRHQ